MCGPQHRNDAGTGVVRRLPSSSALVLNIVSEFANWNAVVMPDLGPLCTATSPLTQAAAFSPLPVPPKACPLRGLLRGPGRVSVWPGRSDAGFSRARSQLSGKRPISAATASTPHCRAVCSAALRPLGNVGMQAAALLHPPAKPAVRQGLACNRTHPLPATASHTLRRCLRRTATPVPVGNEIRHCGVGLVTDVALHSRAFRTTSADRSATSSRVRQKFLDVLRIAVHRCRRNSSVAY